MVSYYNIANSAQNITQAQNLASKWAGGLAILGAANTLYQAFDAKNQAEEQGERYAAALKESQEISKMEEAIRLQQLSDTYNTISKKALTNRATFQVQRMETSSGRTANDLMMKFRKNELDAKTRAKTNAEAAATQAHFKQVQEYVATARKIDQLKDSVPSPLEVGLQIGIQAISAYASFGVVPF